MTSIGTSRKAGRRWAARVAAAGVALGSLAVMSADMSAAQAAPASRSAAVVKVVTRGMFGKILATTKGRSLYILPKGSCTGSCLSVWPPLEMPAGKTVPTGTRCLKTASLHGKLQVTYRGKRLYLFADDSGTSVNGNGEGGFKVAKFSSSACPM